MNDFTNSFKSIHNSHIQMKGTVSSPKNSLLLKSTKNGKPTTMRCVEAIVNA